MQSVAADRMACIVNADGRAELYDIINDSAELHDLAGPTESQTLSRLQQLLQPLRDEARP